MPVTVDTPESAGTGPGDDTGEKALLVAMLLLAENLTDLTAVIIENAAASRDLIARLDRLEASTESKKTSGETPPPLPGTAKGGPTAPERPTGNAIVPVFIVGPAPLPVHDDYVQAILALLRQDVINLGKLSSKG